MANEYAQLANVRERMKLADADTADDAVLSANLEAASRAIDLIGGRAYFATTATRYYRLGALDPIDSRLLHLDADLLTVTSLTGGDGTVYQAAAYVKEPRNTPPYRSIRLKLASAWGWTDTDAEIAVTGTWGAASTPPANIVEATILLTLRLFRRKDSPLGILGMSELGTVVEIGKRDPDVMMLLGPKRVWVV